MPLPVKEGQEMVICKRCKSTRTVKNGIVREKLRYKCKECGYNFVEGDGRTNESLAAKKALAVILYSLGKASYGMLGKIFGGNFSISPGNSDVSAGDFFV